MSQSYLGFIQICHQMDLMTHSLSESAVGILRASLKAILVMHGIICNYNKFLDDLE